MEKPNRQYFNQVNKGSSIISKTCQHHVPLVRCTDNDTTPLLWYSCPKCIISI